MKRKIFAVFAGLGCLLFSGLSAWALPNWIDVRQPMGGELVTSFLATEAVVPEVVWQHLPSAGVSDSFLLDGGETLLARDDLALILDHILVSLHVRGLPPAVFDNFTFSSHPGHQEGSMPTPVPEPATLLLLGTGLICSAAFYRKRVNG